MIEVEDRTTFPGPRVTWARRLEESPGLYRLAKRRIPPESTWDSASSFHFGDESGEQYVYLYMFGERVIMAVRAGHFVELDTRAQEHELYDRLSEFWYGWALPVDPRKTVS